jgi:hypothetical protein
LPFLRVRHRGQGRRYRYRLIQAHCDGERQWTLLAVQERSRAGAGMTMAQSCAPTPPHIGSSGSEHRGQ